MVAVVGAVEFERALAAAKCLDDVPLGDLEELSRVGSPSTSFGSAWSVWIAVLTVADGGIAACEQGDGPGEFGAAPRGVPPCRRAAR